MTGVAVYYTDYDDDGVRKKFTYADLTAELKNLCFQPRSVLPLTQGWKLITSMWVQKYSG